ncbi:MAG TPA: hypothetical protein VG346_15980 [Acidimicrobiales bacterium]|nr:hypothetical protein [Acidimicrobiales bacterium]
MVKATPCIIEEAPAPAGAYLIKAAPGERSMGQQRQTNWFAADRPSSIT